MANSMAENPDNLRYAAGMRLPELGLSAPCQGHDGAGRGHKLCVRKADVFRSQQASCPSHPRMQVDSQHTGTSADLSTMACMGPPAEAVAHKSYGS